MPHITREEWLGVKHGKVCISEDTDAIGIREKRKYLECKIDPIIHRISFQHFKMDEEEANEKDIRKEINDLLIKLILELQPPEKIQK